MAERTRGWEKCRPARSTLTRPSCSAGARARASGPAPWLAAALRSGPSATAASSSAACVCPGRAANREVRTAAQPVSQGQRLGGPAAAGGGIVGDHLGQLDQRHRITGRLGEHLRPRPPAGRARLPVQQEAGVRRGQRLQMQLREDRGQSREAGPALGRPPAAPPARRPGGCRRTPARPASCGPATARHRRPPGPGTARTDPTAGSGRPPRSAAGPRAPGSAARPSAPSRAWA